MGSSFLAGGYFSTLAPGDSAGVLTGIRTPLRAVGRVGVPAINIYREPSFDAERTGKQERDDLLWLIEQVVSPAGPAHNPIWYRVHNGYAHSGRLQVVKLAPPNIPLQSIPAYGILGEVTVPISQSFRFASDAGWQPLYRLYAHSIHRITHIDTGPDGRTWYRLFDDLMNAEYHAQAIHFRPIDPSEYAPISTHIPSDEKRILVSIQDQTLTAFEGDQPVLHTTISSGVHTENLPADAIPTDTPTGSFRIQLKMPCRHMGDGRLTAEIDAYELPGVPWTMVFQKDGVALHGTFWHHNFGTRMSHGCVNLRNQDAQWLFRWTEPAYQPENWFVRGVGTLVVVT